jgi:hypothetical protein
MYKLAPPNIINKTQDAVIRLEDNAIIPFASDNTDYQAYLKWVEEGGVPTPADE